MPALRSIFDNIDNQKRSKEIEEIGDLIKSGVFDEEMDIDDVTKTEVKKPCLRDEDELNVFKTPEKSVENLHLSPPPTNHTQNRLVFQTEKMGFFCPN